MKKGIASAMSRIKDYLNTTRAFYLTIEISQLQLMLICLAVGAFCLEKKIADLEQKRSKDSENTADYVSE